MDTRFIGDRIQLTIYDGEGRDLSSGYTLSIVVVRQSDDTVTDTIPATAGGTGNKSIIADRLTIAAAFAQEGVHTYHAVLLEPGGESHLVGLGYIDIEKVPGT